MKYFDGQDVMLGDKVKLGNDEGVVVCSIDTGEFSPEHPASAWAYLKRGVMITFPSYGLIHFQDAEEDRKLLERAH